MALDKAIASGKEKRRPYRKSKAIDGHCRNHGLCEYCVKNRRWFDTKHRMISDEKLNEWRKEWQE
jgi:hypothetical protein